MREGALDFDFSCAVAAQQFDDHGRGAPGLSHCMKAVDFIVETDARLLLIEVKDFDDPQAQLATLTRPQITEEIQAQLEALQRGKWTLSVFVQKCRDTLLYQWGTQQLDFTNPRKPITYCVVIAAARLSLTDLLMEQDRLRHALPLVGPKDMPWRKPVEDCLVFSLDTWNRHFANFPVSRVL